MNDQGKRSKSSSLTKKSFLPKDTTSILESGIEIENLNLQLYRYAYTEENKNGGFHKKELCFKISDVYQPILTNLNEHIQNVWKPIKIQNKPFIVSQQSRWAIGIGGGSPYGNLLLPALHPLYGFPYIPASTLKGLMRNSWIDKNCNNDENSEEVLRLFGSPASDTSDDRVNLEGKVGQLIFFDGIPSADCVGKLVKDVFAPHYPDYYNSFGGTPPTDDQNPVPIEFLCIEDFTFNIYIGTREKLSEEEKIKLQNTLNYVFSGHGIGAKTALGYGRGELSKII